MKPMRAWIWRCDIDLAANLIPVGEMRERRRVERFAKPLPTRLWPLGNAVDIDD